nr:MAG TPA: hypothetical protein [Caudoviricetes sp.]
MVCSYFCDIFIVFTHVFLYLLRSHYFTILQSFLVSSLFFRT